MAEFKIGRLRVTWGGPWATGTFYNRDYVIQHGGKTYICLIPHTSGDFYGDLYHTTGAGASTPYWSLTVDGKTFIGNWLTNTFYDVGNIVHFGGSNYICTTQHTSSGTTLDLSKWTTYSQTYNWSNAWTVSTAYAVGDVIKYGGIVYRCNTNHTSTGSTSSINLTGITNNAVPLNVTNATGTQTTVTLTFATQAGAPFVAGDTIVVSNIVNQGGPSYNGTFTVVTCSTTQVTFASTAFSNYVSGGTIVRNPTVATLTYATQSAAPYYAGQTITVANASPYSGTYTVVTCSTTQITVASNTSGTASSGTVTGSAIGLENNLSNWDILYRGTEYKGSWTGSTQYKLNDIVKEGAALWLVSTGHLSSATFDSTKFTSWIPGIEFSNTWSSAISYQVGDVVLYGGYVYISVTSNNTNNTPFSSGSNWTLLSTGYELKGTYDGTVQYKIGDVVTQGGRSYVAVADSSTQNPSGTGQQGTTYTAAGSSGTTIVVGNLPNGYVPGMIVQGTGFTLGQTVISAVTGASTTTLILDRGPDGTLTDSQFLNFYGANPAYWNVIIPGVAFRGFWNAAAQYTTGDVVVLRNMTYFCIQQHSNQSPTSDNSRTYWSFYVAHYRKNASGAFGDIETYNTGPGYTAVPIGSDTYVLRSTNKLPTWSYTNQVPSVYYVSGSNGTDRTDYGKTWDQPWKTIKYACGYVGAGTLYPTESALVQTNKEYLVAEMYQWMLYQKTNSNTPFSPSSVFDQTKTKRDARYVVDAITYDLARGGNSQTVATAKSYFADGSTNTFFSTTVAAEMPFFIASLTYLKSLVSSIILNIGISPSYQSINGVQSPLTQTLAGNYQPNLDAQSLSNSLFNYIITALTNQNTNQLPSPNTGLTATIFIKTGTYAELLPITIPENVALVGDELRGVVVQPSNIINQTVTSVNTSNNKFTVGSTAGMTDLTPVQFVSNVNTAGVVYTLGGVTAGTTYYVNGSTITSTSFGVYSTGGTFSSLSATNITVGNPSASGARFTVSYARGATAYTVTNVSAGADSSYTPTDVLKILGTSIGGLTPDNDLTITITGTGGVSNSIASFSVSGTPATTLALTSSYIVGTMPVYGGNALSNMFYMRNASGLRNVTLTGLLGTLSAVDANLLARPTGGAYTSLDPGTGPDDTSAWIFKRSPYIQNVTTFGTGCIGLKIDGTLHNGGNKSIVSNDFTQVLSDGVGIWCTGPNSLTEAVSVFSYYCYAGYFAEAGGRIRATNGNSSYGTYGCVATGYDITETPITGNIFNQSLASQATVQQAFGTSAQILKFNFSNAGSNYVQPTTNFLSNSNIFNALWSGDGNLTYAKVSVAPTGQTEAWTLTSTNASAGAGYFYMNNAINPSGITYTDVPQASTSGGGSAAVFNVTITPTGYLVTNGSSGGSGYVLSNTITLSGASVGGVTGTNDIIITIGSLTGSAVNSFSFTGTVPAGSTQQYTVSLHVKQGSSQSVDLQAIFSGSSSVTSGISYNFATGKVTPSAYSTSGFVPTQYGAQLVTTANTTGWYRLWFNVQDSTGLNNNLQYRFYPSSINGSTNYTFIYGSQLEITPSSGLVPSYYQENTGSDRYSQFAYFQVSGAGTGAKPTGDELRSRAIFQSRVTDPGTGLGGAGYLTASNYPTTGDTGSITISTSDTNTISNYLGMRLFIQSGTGAGQYGYISSYNTSTKVVQVLKESFDAITITNTTASGGVLTVAGSTDMSGLYAGQPVQFIPKYTTITVTATSLAQMQATASVGGSSNTITVTTTVGLTQNMPVSFTGTTFGQITTGYQFYIAAIIDGTTIKITNLPFSTVWQLTTASGNLTMNYPAYNSYITCGSTTNMLPNLSIQFTGTSLGGLNVGTIYYINDVINSTTFTIASSAVSTTLTDTVTGTNVATVASSTQLVSLNPIVFNGTTIGGIVAGTKYYIARIPSTTTIILASALTTVTCTATTAATGLITVSDTTNFVVNNPIKFSGTTLGGIVVETTYFILAINNGTSFTISQTPGGSAVALRTETGTMTARTALSTQIFALSNGSSGTATATSTTARSTVNVGVGTMNATFSTALFGGVVAGTTYYVNTINTGANTMTVSSSLPIGTPITLSTATGSMNLGAVGWDHINPGTPIQSTLDYTSVYYIEPRVTYTDPTFSQTASNTVVSAGSGSWIDIAYGNNYFVAVQNASSGSIVATTQDGNSWTQRTVPVVGGTYSTVAYGNNYFVALSSGSATAIFSNSNGVAWRQSTLPYNTAWKKIVYGNGLFVAIDTSSALSAYSADFGKTWTTALLPSDKVVTASVNAQLSTTQKKFGVTSLYLDGSSYITAASNADYGYGTGDFTVEFFIYATTFATAPALLDQRTAASEASVTIDSNVSGNIRFYVNGAYAITSNTVVSLNTWTHIAISKVSGTTRMFVGGTLQTTTYSDSNTYAARPVSVGSYYSHSGGMLNGYVDELRITKGTGRYTTTFTPTTSEFVPDANTKLLMHFNGTNASTLMQSATFSGTWVSLTFGNGTYLATTATGTGAYSADGITWTSTTLPTASTYTAVKYGNGRFVAVTSASGPSAYSFDAITWYTSNLSIAATQLIYGQGAFLALTSGSANAYLSEDGFNWRLKTVTSSAYSATTFGYNASNVGIFVTLAGASTGSYIGAGVRAKGRPSITSGSLTSTSLWEPGSNYTSTPTLTLTDPNVTALAVVTPRIANGVLGNPTFINRGSGYTTTSTFVSINGNGYSDNYQTGYSIIMNNMTSLPVVGSDLTIAGDSQVYKVTVATPIYGTVAPAIEAIVQLSPSITTTNSPANATAVSIRTKYSQVRLTNHDFLNVGYGNIITSNYPNYPAAGYVAVANNQTVEVNYGRVFFTSTDQDGNFKVGNLFGVQQSTGIVTLSATQFGLLGLTSSLSLGGIAVGGSSVVISQFSTDSTFVANSDGIIPTQKAIKAYLASRLSQGGSNTATGTLIAGTVVIGGVNYINSNAGITNQVNVKVNINGALASVGGNMAALDYFVRSFNHRSSMF